MLHHLLLAASMVVMVSSSAELAEPPSGHRFQLIRLSPTAIPASMRCFHLRYVMQLRIGDSWLSGIADTGSDLIWTNNSQLIDSTESCPCDTVKDCCHGLCTFKREYGGDSVVTGVMGKANLTYEESNYTLNIGSAVMFGCHLSSNEKHMGCKAYRDGGIVGLGRGDLSLVRQLRLHSFSYCLAEQTSFIKLNDSVALPNEDKQKQNTTKFVTTNECPLVASKYYVKLKKIVLGGTNTEIPNGCFQQDTINGDGGMVIDSGTSFSMLPEEAFLSITEHVSKLMNKEPIKKSNKQKSTCYDVEELPKDMPEMVLHFCDDVQMVIPVENYIYLKDNEYCLAFQKTLDKYPRRSILGNFQQKNIRMLFNIERGTLSFVKQTCDDQAEEKKHAAV